MSQTLEVLVLNLNRKSVPWVLTADTAASLRPMRAGSEVVEDYGHVGLTLRQHPVSFLRADLARRRVIERSHHLPQRTIYDWRHYLAVVQRKPGALRNSAPFL